MPSLVEVFNRNVVLSYLRPNPIAVSPLVQSGAFVSDDRLRALLTSGSSTFTVPYVNGIDGNVEQNYGNTILTDIAMPRTIEAGAMQGRVAYLNEGFVESVLGQYLSQVNSLELIGGLLNKYWLDAAENRARATVIGLRNYDHANGKRLTTDISASTATEATGFSVDAYIDAESTMKRELRGRGVMFVHPRIAAKMRKQQLLEQVTTSANLPPITVYNGRAVVETDFNTQIGTGANAKFITILAGPRAFSYDSVAGRKDLAVEETQATGNGAGHEILWTRRNMLIHPQGFSFIAPANTLTGGTDRESLSASWEDLQKAANWELVGSPEDNSIRFLITNL
ncbi:hypothetical protein [Acinetobacter sp. V115_6]|uniref:hypothetical protein n=1 Tax=Acinetobacter sp. V115_6 TaxID=3072987 RepID=UPI00287D99C5|nr:hypothetical protein [Acinetobacter sp. V115_6]MDS7927596.1 hypothetical protein [Acinetobacter sp. V115_6]